MGNKNKRKIVVVLSDPHADYKFGLLPPDLKLPRLDESSEIIPDEYWIPKQSSTQEQLWEWYINDRDEVLKLIGKDEMYLLCMGDVIQGNILPRQLLNSSILSDQLLIAKEVLSEYAKYANGGRFCKGTSVHNHGQGSSETVVARELSERYNKDFKAWHHMILDLYGIRFDIAHHGPGNGKRKWLEGNELRLYIKDIMMREIMFGNKPPDIILRGHYHDRILEVVHQHVKDKTYKTFGAICPAYALFMDDYTLKVTKSKSYMTVGVLVVEIINGRIKDIYDDWVHTVDIRRYEEIN